MGLGRRVKEIRERRGISQRELARGAEISSATISRIEGGQLKDLRADAVKRVAGVLGVTVDYLVDEKAELNAESVVRSDPAAKFLFRGFENLSAKGRDELLNFLRYLENQEHTKEEPEE